jgi:hypothetical protein
VHGWRHGPRAAEGGKVAGASESTAVTVAVEAVWGGPPGVLSRTYIHGVCDFFRVAVFLCDVFAQES